MEASGSRSTPLSPEDLLNEMISALAASPILPEVSGFTIPLGSFSHEPEDRGFQVGVGGLTRIFPDARAMLNLSPRQRETLRVWIVEVVVWSEQVDRNEGRRYPAALGGWVNSEFELEIEVSIFVQDRAQAMLMGREHKQEQIRDWEAGENIDVEHET